MLPQWPKYVLAAGLVLALVAAIRPLVVGPPSALAGTPGASAGRAGDPAAAPDKPQGSPPARTAEAAHPETVTVGFYVYDLHDLNLKAGTFGASQPLPLGKHPCTSGQVANGHLIYSRDPVFQ